MGVKDCYTDFHVDFGGTSVWYHVFRVNICVNWIHTMLVDMLPLTVLYFIIVLVCFDKYSYFCYSFVGREDILSDRTIRRESEEI